jgi:hypothetical protein
MRAASIIRANRDIALMFEAARTSETSVIQLRTRQYIPEDYEHRVLGRDYVRCVELT